MYGVSCNAKRRGFTLLELMLVLSLLSILTALTVPKLIRFHSRWVLRSTAHMIANDIRLIQKKSIDECTYYNFELETEKFYYYLKNSDPSKPQTKKVVIDPRITTITSTLKKYYAGENYCVLQFTPLGSPNQAGTISLYTTYGDNINITIDVATGRVKVNE